VLYRVTGRKLPAVVWVSLVGMLCTDPGFPGATSMAAMTGKINFLALATPILAFAGLSIAKDVPAFRRLGWRIVVVSFLANAGTFIGATLIAQFFRHKPVV
jgi:disulfide bond formation protein DsbB